MQAVKQSHSASKPATYAVADNLGSKSDQGKSINAVQPHQTESRQNSDLKEPAIDGFDFAGVAG